VVNDAKISAVQQRLQTMCEIRDGCNIFDLSVFILEYF